jgi:hypothetical protein
MDESKIAAVAQECFASATKTEKPFRAVNDFLRALRSQGWNEVELAEVQSRVLQGLKRLRHDQGGGE